MDFTKKRWVTLAACCLINLCIGSLYAWSVFATPLAHHLNEVQGIAEGAENAFTAGSLAIVFTLSNALGPITMISGGFITNKLGPQKVILLGGILFGAGMFLSGFVGSKGALLLTYGILCGLGVGLAYGCTVGNVVKSFPDKRGLIGGVSTASYGISSVIVPFIANPLISSHGVSFTFRVLGVAFFVIIIAASFLVLPAPANFVPTGWTPPVTTAVKREDKNWKQMLADPTFYLMIVMMTCGAVAGMMNISQASPIAQNMLGMTPAAAATVVSVLALFNVSGRILAGTASDKLGRIPTLMCSFALSIVGLLLLVLSASAGVAVFYIGIALVGLCFGALMGIFPGFTSDQFGLKYNNINYGIMFIGFAFAGYVGPNVMKSIYASSGVYTGAFLFAAALNVVGLALSIVWRLFVDKKKKA